jgi:preprotein translocase subunit SecE
MESNNNKIATVCFMFAGLLIGIFVWVMMNTAAAIATGDIGRALSGDLARHGLPALIGFACFIGFQFNKGIVAWSDEVITETRRVVWPSRKDTVAMTVVVCIMLLICGAAFGIMDVVSGSVVDWALHLNLLGALG